MQVAAALFAYANGPAGAFSSNTGDDSAIKALRLLRTTRFWKQDVCYEGKHSQILLAGWLLNLRSKSITGLGSWSLVSAVVV